MFSADVIVVGLGAMGSAACRQLAASGVSVIGIDRYAPPHTGGSTHGDTRITRLAIGEGREYVPLARRSHELWREIEAESGEQLLTQTGIIVLAHPSSVFLTETRAAALQYGIEHRDLTNEDVRAEGSRCSRLGSGRSRTTSRRRDTCGQSEPWRRSWRSRCATAPACTSTSAWRTGRRRVAASP